jgi:AcrR family transcriptional regulator
MQSASGRCTRSPKPKLFRKSRLVLSFCPNKKRTFVFLLNPEAAPTYVLCVARRALRPSADRILAAAETLFATNGYGDVSLRQLIAAAGVSTTAFYARFDSKDAVLEKLVEQLFTDLYTEATKALPQAKNLEDGIERGIEILCDRFGPRKSLVRLVIAETGSVAGLLEKRRSSYAMLVGFLSHYLRALQTRGRIHVTDPEAMAWALVGALEMQLTRWAVWDELDLDQLRAQLLGVSRAILPEERS